MKKTLITLALLTSIISCKKKFIEPVKVEQVVSVIDTNYLSCNIKFDNIDNNTTIRAYDVNNNTVSTGGDFQWRRSESLLNIQQKTIGSNKPLSYTLTVINNKTNEVSYFDNKGISNALGYGMVLSYLLK